MTTESKRESQAVDAVVVGGGFYGCCLALFLRSVVKKVLLIEARDELLTRASYVNQARVHTGYHYPRSFVTARRSLALYKRFIADFPDAVVDDFQSLYAIARSGSKVTPQRFETMFRDLGAPISRATEMEQALFDPQRVAAVFRCQEHVFDATKLRTALVAKLEARGVEIVTSTEVSSIDPGVPNGVVTLTLDSGVRIQSRLAIDATYGQLCARSNAFAEPALRLKYELTEIALVEVPPELSRYAITLMDGPFFSTMPFPARGCHSLTHVRYTPHRAWTSARLPEQTMPRHSHWLHMRTDAARYVPMLSRVRWIESLYEVKTVLLRNEGDDGRPILLHRDARNPNVMCVLGGKLDNIYDLFDALRAMGGPLAAAHTGYLDSAET